MPPIRGAGKTSESQRKRRKSQVLGARMPLGPGALLEAGYVPDSHHTHGCWVSTEETVQLGQARQPQTRTTMGLRRGPRSMTRVVFARDNVVSCGDVLAGKPY